MSKIDLLELDFTKFRNSKAMSIHHQYDKFVSNRVSRPLRGCQTGEAKITNGYKLPARYVIHTVGPVWKGSGSNEAELLRSCYQESLELAVEYNCQSIAFSAISTGVYGFPADKAAEIAVATVETFLKNQKSPLRVIFCCFTEDSAEHHRRYIKK